MTMALTDTFVKQVKLVKPTGDKYTDGEGKYLLVLASGKYWRMDYRYLGKRMTMALGVYPATSLAKARLKRADVREKLADGIDPSLAKREERDAQTIAASQTFELIARQWLLKTAADRATTTQVKVTGWLEKDVFPSIGTMPISAIKPRDVLITVQKMETRGAVESAHRVKQICGQVFRYAVASGLAERDVTADLRGALAIAGRWDLCSNQRVKFNASAAELIGARIQVHKGQPFQNDGQPRSRFRKIMILSMAPPNSTH
jgi:hypothetical protein